MGSIINLLLAALAGLAILTYLRLDSLPMPLPSTLPIGPLDPTKTPHPVAAEGFAPRSLLVGGEGGNATTSTSSTTTSPLSLPVVRLFEGRIFGSESVAVSPDGSGDLIMCDRYGYVWRATKNNNKKKASSSPADEYELEPRPLAHLGAGRPLGFHFDAGGNLVVCVAGSGLVMVEAGAFSRDAQERAKAKVVLLTAAVSPPMPSSSSSSSSEDKNGKDQKQIVQKHSPILYANDLDISEKTGIIYFTDSAAMPPARNRAGFWDTMQAYILSLAQGQPTGRLLSYDPRSRRTDVVADGLWFGNGVALSPGEDWAAVVESSALRVYKVPLSGPQKGIKEVLIDRLPGYPDGIARAFVKNGKGDGRNAKSVSQDGFWLALISPWQPIQAQVIGSRLGRLLMAWAPESWRPPLSAWGAAVRLRVDRSDSGGVGVVGWVVEPTGDALSSTSAVTDTSEYENGDDDVDGGRLFFGNLGGDYVSFVDGAARSVEAAAARATAASAAKTESGGGERSEL